jgi:hypothetical protein
VTKLSTVALATVISVLSKPLTSSLNVAVTLNKPVTVGVEVDVKATVGGVMSGVVTLAVRVS